MLLTIKLFVEILALVFAGLAAFKCPEPPRLSFGAMAFFLFLLSLLVR